VVNSLARVQPAARRRPISIFAAESGEWVARDGAGAAERRFPSRRAALHFVLFERGARAPAALLTPEAG
jgi:hypothetical protein